MIITVLPVKRLSKLNNNNTTEEIAINIRACIFFGRDKVTLGRIEAHL